jgi:hypothetical protein
LGAFWIFPLIALFSTIILIYVIYFRARRSPSALIWIAMLSFFLLWNVGEFSQKWLGDDPSVIGWLSLCIVFGDIFPAIFLIFTLQFPVPNEYFTRYQRPIVLLVLVPKIVSLLITLFFGDYSAPPDMGSNLHFGYYPFLKALHHVVEPIGGWYFYYGLGHSLLLISLGAGVLVWNFLTFEQKFAKEQIQLILVGFVVFVILGTLTLFILPLFGLYPPELFSAGTLVLNIIVAYGLLRGEAPLFSPIAEKSEKKEYDTVLRIGDFYLCSREKGMQTFSELVSQGFEGLYVGAVKPDLDITRFKRIPIVILTDAGQGLRQYGNLKYVPADELKTLKSSIFTFVESATRGVVYLDNMDQVLEKNWAPPAEFVEFGMEMRKAQIMNVIWLFGTPLKKDDKIERLRDLMGSPITKKAIILDQLKSVVSKARLPRAEVEANLKRLTDIEPIFGFIKYKGDTLIYDERVAGFPGILALDPTEAIRMFVQQVRPSIPRPYYAAILKDLKNYGISRYDFLLRPGDSYLLEETFEDRGKAYEIYISFLEKGFKGMCISRSEPTKLKQRYLLPMDTPIYWITQDRKEDMDIKPAPEYLMVNIKAFIDKQGKEPGIILLDGLEYLITFQGDQFDSYLKVLRRIADLISQSGVILVIPYDPVAIPADRVALFRRSGIEVITRDMLV